MITINPATPGTKSLVPGNVLVRELETRLRNTQQSVVRQRVTAGLLALAVVLTVALAAVAIVDYFAELALVWRAAWFLGALVALGATGLVGWKRFIARYSLARAAADAEGHVIQFGQRLRTTLDYEQQSPPPAQADTMLLAALQRDTCQVARNTNWANAVDVRPVFLASSAAALVAFAMGIALLSSGDFRIAVGRALLLPLEFTNVTFSPQTQTVRIGESVAIKARVLGRPVASAVVRYRAARSQDEWTAVDLNPVASNDAADATAADQPPKAQTKLQGELMATLANLKHDLEFEVVAGPRALPPGAIQVLQPLTLEDAQARVMPPAYTAKPEDVVTGLDLRVLEGSTLELTFNFNRAPVDAKATPVDSSSMAGDVTLVIAGTAVRGTLVDVRKSASLMLTAQAADGMVLEPLRLNIRVQPDRKPEVKFIAPPEELVVTASTEVPMLIEAGDDIGLHKVGILFQINDGEMHVLCEQDAAGSTEPFSVSQELLLEDYGLSHNDAVTYYAFAEDNYFGQVRRTTTALRYIDIRPYQTTFQLVEGGGTCNGCSTTLEELIARQRQNLSLAFAAQGESHLEHGTADRLAENQFELLEKTREFEQGIAQRAGPIAMLASAVVAMQSAVDALSARQLADAVAAEKQALADLIRARENVRQKLSQSSRQSASACRKFDREQRQKLRLPDKTKQDRQQQVADLRAKLDDLAQRERKWSQECQQCNRASSSGQPSQAPNSPSAQGQKQGQQQSESRSPEEIARDQEKMRAELAELRDRLEKLAAAGQAAREQARQADEAMGQGLKELEKQDGLAAAQEGERSARQLERLSDHLAAMNASDFGQRLDQAQKLARQLADRQKSLQQAHQSIAENDAKKSTTGALARNERGLAGEADMLAEQLEALERDASTERGGIQRKLREVHAENPPREISNTMRQAVGELESDRKEPAGRSIAQAQRRLDELGRSLRDIQSEYSQPALEELIALEQQLASLMEQSKRVGKGNEQVTPTGQKWSDFESRLEGPARGDKRLATALHRMREGVTPEGHYSWLELGDFTGPREVAQVLQTKIQEAILAGALQDANPSIPPEYKALVEKYYRALSDDLR